MTEPLLLSKAMVGLYSQPSRQVVLPHLTSVQPSTSYDGTLVRFAGDRLPTPFGGQGESGTYPLTCRYGRHEQQLLKDFLDLVGFAARAADRRLLLRTHYGQVPGLDVAQAVVIWQVSPAPQIGLYIDLSFTALAVQDDEA